jgi:hypothetical protein
MGGISIAFFVNRGGMKRWRSLPSEIRCLPGYNDFYGKNPLPSIQTLIRALS